MLIFKISEDYILKNNNVYEYCKERMNEWMTEICLMKYVNLNNW